MVEAGYRVLGFDVSPAMIALAKAHVPGGEFRIGSFVSAEVPRCVAVTAIGEVLNYGFDSGNDAGARRDLFRRVYEELVPGGIFLFDVAGFDRAPRDGRQRTFAEGPDWAVLVETQSDTERAGLTRHITSFRRVGARFRRDAEVHRLTLLDPAALLTSLSDAGFRAESIDRYGATPSPCGVTVFLCRKPGGAPDAHDEGLRDGSRPRDG